jgi:phenylalanyl-tRNA synthetase alpha chain
VPARQGGTADRPVRPVELADFVFQEGIMVGDRLDDALARLATVRAEALTSIGKAASGADIEALRIRYTGKRSELSQVMQVMGQLRTPEDRKRLGAEVNTVKAEIEAGLQTRTAKLHRTEQEARLREEALDVTLPGAPVQEGFRHPLLQTLRELLDILEQMGFAISDGPEVEWERYNFDMLNIPKYHPARDVQDTFWISDDMLLRTQTSPAQIRYMHSHEPPMRVAVPGWVYRNEAEDASHLDQFLQIEGLAVDTNITLADLKGTLTELVHRFFGPDRRVRFRPHYFPFTEPSAELDVECAICRGAGCRSCGGEGWLELLGSGMVHPTVLRYGGYDPEKVSGFAFGMGPDRFNAVKYGIPDLRLSRENDLRFLRQFN